MSKGLRNYPPEERSKIARRRLMSQTKGLGYLAAKDYLDKTGIKTVKTPPYVHKEEDHDECPQEARERGYRPGTDTRSEP